MAIDKIDKKLSNIPLLRKRITVNPTIQADKDDFMDKYETTNDHLSNKTVGELNQIIDEVNITTEQIDETVTIINTQTETVITKANEASESASEAEGYKNQAEAAVASLPIGTLNDSTISTATVWSSQKIADELDSKANKASPTFTGVVIGDEEASQPKHLTTLAMVQATALYF